MRVALVEDDSEQAALFSLWLEEAGFSCHRFASGGELLVKLERERYGAMVLDWMLPDISGLTVLDHIRENRGLATPVLFVTRRKREQDIVRALQHGADDYMTKPVKRGEMIARLEAIHRRAVGSRNEGPRIGPYHFDDDSHVVFYHGMRLRLTRKEYVLARMLFRNLGNVLARTEMLEAVWGSDDASQRTLDTHISRVRRKLSLFPHKGWRLSAVYQFGYRLERIEPWASIPGISKKR